MMINTKGKCNECKREFDLLDEEDANEFHFGHDCEPEPKKEKYEYGMHNPVPNFRYGYGGRQNRGGHETWGTQR